MKKKTSRKRHLFLSKNFILMLVALVIIIATVSAWFTVNKEVTANNMSVVAKSVDKVELAVPKKVAVGDDPILRDSFPVDNSLWHSSIQFKTTGYLKDLVKDITSDGIEFVVPNFEVSSSLKEGRTVNTGDVWVEGLSSMTALTNKVANDDDQYDYLSFDFYIRSQTKDIKVREGSFLASDSDMNNKPYVGKASGDNPVILRPSSYGAGSDSDFCFSADAVIGAMRVSLVGSQVTSLVDSEADVKEPQVSTPALQFVWLPRPDIYLSTEENSNDWRLVTGVKPTGNSERSSMGTSSMNTSLNLTAAQVDEIANKTYSHTFYDGLMTGSTGNEIKKGLKKKTYWDDNVKSPSGELPNGESTPSNFYVSDTRNDSELGSTGHIPKFNQTAQIAGATETQASNITFNATGEEDDLRPTSGYYVYKFTMNIWIEGEDAEARRSMNTGVFSLQLEFSS